MSRAYVALGSNTGDPAVNVERGFGVLAEIGSVLRRSSLYRTPPWGKTDQPDFVNAVALVETALAPRELLDALKAAERRLGRTPGERWGPRVIDLDLLTYDDVTIDEPDFHVPHAQLRCRGFVLVPLAEIDRAYVPLRDALDPSELAGITQLERAGRDLNRERVSIEMIIRSVVALHVRDAVRGSERRLVPAIRRALESEGYNAAAKCRLQGPISLGLDPKTLAPRKALSWAEADIRVARNGELLAIVESEHDLAWVVPIGSETPRSSASWRYTMASIASDAAGNHFPSYAPLERMAYIARWQTDAATTARELASIRSNDVREHNPSGLPLFLVSETADAKHRILLPRLRSLNACYIQPSPES